MKKVNEFMKRYAYDVNVFTAIVATLNCFFYTEIHFRVLFAVTAFVSLVTYIVHFKDTVLYSKLKKS